MTDISDLRSIEDVDKGIMQYINQVWGIKYYLPGILFILSAIAESYFAGTQFLFIVCIIWLIGGYGIAASKVKEAFMRQFAKANGFVYVPYAPVDSVIGTIFQKGHSKNISNVVEGSQNGRKLRFFFYSYAIGEGKQQKNYEYSVCEINFGVRVPHIVVETREDWDFTNYAGPDHRELHIEGNFQDFFAVYALDNFEIETLEIFTPEVLEKLINEAKKYNFEFIEDRLYIFRRGIIAKKAELDEFLGISKYLVEKFSPRLFSMQDDLAALKSVD